ncbi:DNA helicase [Tanacetum coccineum]
MSMSFQKPQVHKMAKFTRLFLVDDLKVFKITFSHSSQDKATSSHLKFMITTSNHKLMIEVKDYELKTEYVVTAFCAIEQNRIDYVRKHQNDIRNEYLSGIYDAINRGDSDGSDCGARLILPQSFTDGPRYMYNHYLDALAICRVHGNPSFFITFTCNVKWPEIMDYMADFPLFTTTDRADIVDKVFEMKSKQLIKYLRDVQPFGRGRTVAVRVRRDEDIDSYVSAELP